MAVVSRAAVPWYSSSQRSEAAMPVALQSLVLLFAALTSHWEALHAQRQKLLYAIHYNTSREKQEELQKEDNLQSQSSFTGGWGINAATARHRGTLPGGLGRADCINVDAASQGSFSLTAYSSVAERLDSFYHY